MAHALETRASSPANDLRDTLNQVERLIVDPRADTVETLLTSLDKIATMFGDLTKTDIDLRPEEARWEGILRRLHSKPGKIATAVRGAGGFAKLRSQYPPAEGEWWQLDQVINQHRQKRLRSALRTGAVVAAILALVYFLLPEPNPDAVFVLTAEASMEDALVAGDLGEAQRTALDAAEELPTSPELWLWVTVLSEQLDDDATAERAFKNASALIPDQPVLLWIDLGNKRLQIGDLDGAEAAANQVLVLDDSEPQAYFLLASASEMRGKNREAIDYFEKTFELAEEDDPQLAVIAKVRMGTLMQSLNPFETAEPDDSSESGSSQGNP